MTYVFLKLSSKSFNLWGNNRNRQSEIRLWHSHFLGTSSRQLFSACYIKMHKCNIAMYFTSYAHKNRRLKSDSEKNARWTNRQEEWKRGKKSGEKCNSIEKKLSSNKIIKPRHFSASLNTDKVCFMYMLQVTGQKPAKDGVSAYIWKEGKTNRRDIFETIDCEIPSA